ncbi:leucyl aminopeptidase [Candidatus Mycalebacterium sp.]
MTSFIRVKNPHRTKTDLLAIGVYEGEKRRFSAIDKKLKGAISRASKRASGLRLGGFFTVDTVGNLPASEVMIVGLGDKKSFSAPSDFFKAASVAAKNAGSHVKEIVLDFPASGAPALRALMEGALCGSYVFSKYKSGSKKEGAISSVAVYSTASETSFKSTARAARSISSAVRLCRDMINEPPAHLTPSVLADYAQTMCSEEGLSCSVIMPDEMKKRGMGGMLAVSAGSSNPPRLIHMTYSPKAVRSRPVAIVGKGITFDSGGLSLKPAEAMKTMKMDMSGAAAVVGAMKAIAAAKPGVTVHGIVAAAENMTGPSAYKPDDIVTAMNGKTIEIVNTDAEGRVVLADALSYAVEIGSKEIIDLATLTGACVVALGVHTAGLMSNSEKIARDIKRSSHAAGEKVWELPLSDDMRKDIESDFADIKNTGNRWGGAITAALFLEHFVSSVPWAHLDIAGPAYLERGSDWYPKGATGFGVRLLVDYILRK